MVRGNMVRGNMVRGNMVRKYNIIGIHVSRR